MSRLHFFAPLPGGKHARHRFAFLTRGWFEERAFNEALTSGLPFRVTHSLLHAEVEAAKTAKAGA